MSGARTALPLEALVDAIARCSPHVRDGLARGTLASYDALRAEQTWMHDEGSTDAAARALLEIEAGLRPSPPMTVLASRMDYPPAGVVAVYRREGWLRHGGSLELFLVDVVCPYAGAHTSRLRGHERHTHGVRLGHDVPAAGGPIGTRVPRCEGATGSGDVLANYELRLPRGWRSMLP